MLIPAQKIVSECGKASLYIENNMSLGALHDFLLLNKGNVVDMMVSAQKQEEAVSEAHKAHSSCCEEGDHV